MQPLNPVIAEVSPNIYAAAKQANLDPTQVNQVEQMSFAMKKHKELLAMPAADAQTAFNKLDPNIQSGLKFLFKNAQYSQPAPTLGQEVWGGLKTIGKAIASPIIGLFKVAGAYNRAINTPYLVAREVAQGDGSVLDGKVWKAAWDGNAIFDHGSLQKAVDVFGASDVEVAKGLIAGKTPGEIVQTHGKVDQALLDSIQKAFNSPNDFKQVLDGVKYAQVSPGRDFARMSDDKPVPSGGLHGDYVSSGTKNLSGVVDTVYQIVLDPLTWLTGGGSKAATLGERLTKTIIEAANNGDLAGGVAKVMQHPQVNELWQNQLGPAIKRFAEAPTAAGKSNVYREIASTFPGYANRDIIEKLAAPDAKVFDAPSAQKYFEQADNTHLMLSGRVDGVTYARNGVATARTTRNFADGFMTYLDSVFNPTTSKTLGMLKTTGRDVAKVDELGEPLYQALIKTGESLDKLAFKNPELDKLIADASGEIGKLKKLGYGIGKQAARSAAGQEIRLGDRAAETANHFTNMARQLLPRDMADFMTTKFIAASADEQVVILRNVYAAIMHKFGMGGTQEGRTLMNTILREKFGTKAGFATLKDTKIPEHALEHLEPTSIRIEDGVPHLQSEDAIQPNHTAHAIGSLPYDKIAEFVTQEKSKKNLLNAVLGIGSSPFAKKAVDTWSFLTLLPRLGIRSAIDEGMMFALTAPGRDLLAYATRRGHAMGKVSTSFTGSKAAVGPIREGLGKLFPKIDPTNAIDIEKRQALINDLAKKLNVDPGDLYDLQKREVIASFVDKIYGKHLDKEAEGYFMQGLIHHPDMLTSVAQSFVGHSGLSGNFGEEVLKGIITPSQLDAALEEQALKMGRKYRSIDTTLLSDKEVALAHFDKWFRGFVANKVSLPNKRILSPATVFFTNHGLKTSEDVKKAMDDMSAAIGVVFNPATKQYVVKDQEAVNAFKEMSARTVEMNARGIDDAALVRDQVGRILMDLYTTFHGGATNFNQELLNHVGLVRAKMLATTKREIPPTWSQAAAGVDFKTFEELSKDNRIAGEVNTSIEFEGFQDFESLWRKVGNKGFEWMDRQITGIHRQAALNVTYTEVRKNWAGIERQWVKDHVNQMVNDNPNKYTTKGSLDRLTTDITSQGEKRFTELAMNHAADEMLKYADNPAVRSNFAYASRTLGRYYRATEDFQRRMYRLKEVPARVLYRLRLTHLGLAASGAVYQDQQGNPYIMMPMDSTLYKATDSTIRALTGNTGYSQPLFNDFTLKLNMINPSFQQDSGLPMLSGPIAGLGVIGIKNLLGYTGSATAIKAGNTFSTAALGNFGTNTNITQAVMPQSLLRVWQMLPFSEQSRQEVTAAQQAMAYNAANGVHLDPNATDQEKAKYLADLKISAHNIIFMRNFLGFMAPETPTMVESKGVPDYLKRVGVTSLRSEFYDLLNNVTAVKNGDIQDPYEAALVAYQGKYPGKLIYTVSRTSKQTRVQIKDFTALNNWAINNQSFIKTYGEAAYIFAPQTGKLNSSSYNYLQAAGLVTSKTLEQYYNDLLVSEDKQAYYDLGTNEKAALAAEPDASKRAQIIADATSARDSLKNSNPLLPAALIGAGNNVGNESKLLANLDQIVNDPRSPMDSSTRTRMALAIKMMKDFIAFSTDPNMKSVSNFTDLKQERKQQIEANLNDLMLNDLYLNEANRAIFKSILGFYSRDSYVAFKKGF